VLPQIEVRGVSKVFGALEALAPVTFEVAAGETVTLLGPSGCGKTTLLRLIAGLETATTGDIVVNGMPPSEARRRKQIGFVPQSPALLPWRTVYGNVELALESRRVPRVERPEIINTLLGRVGLADRADAFPVQLSGGMQQRLQIARCLAQSPQVLLMDEPFGALDAMTRQSLQDEVARLSAESGKTVVFVTHDLEEAIYLGDRVISMESRPGRIGEVVDVNLPRPRNQLTTREDPRFLSLRHKLFNLLPTGH